MRPAIILFARAPLAGRVKTRLQTTLGEEATLALHTAFVQDTLDKLTALSSVAAIEVHTDTGTDVWRRDKVTFREQVSGNLGLKIIHALNVALAEGRESACVVGSDSPTLPLSHLESLLASPADVALGPCDDGGFYAVSCRRTHPAMFAQVEWSSHRTLRQTESAARRAGLSVELGGAWYDVDEPADLARLMAEIDLPAHTRRWRERWLPS